MNNEEHESGVLLIGGNGFIGSHLQDELISHGYRVHVLDRNGELFRPPQKGIKYYQGEFSNLELLNEAMNGCDLIIHLAHTSTPLASMADSGIETVNQVKDFVKLLEFVHVKGLRKVVYFSSGGAVYGNQTAIPVKESADLNPVSLYGLSKVMMEKYLQTHAYLHDLRYLIIRPSNPYGPRQNYMGSQGVIPIFIRKMLCNEDIEIWGDGSASKDYIYISDLVRATRLLLNEGIDNNVYNVASGSVLSINQLLAAVSTRIGCTPNVSYIPECKVDVKQTCLSYEKLTNRMGWRAKFSFEQGLNETVDWISRALNVK